MEGTFLEGTLGQPWDDHICDDHICDDPRGGRGGWGGRAGRGGAPRGRSSSAGAAGGSPLGSIQRRLARRRPAESLVECVLRLRARAAPPLQLVSASATITPELRRQLASLIGGAGKRSAGTVVTADPAHPPPKALKPFGVGGVMLPSTMRHSAYFGKQTSVVRMLQLAFEEHDPHTALLVLPNGHSVPRMVEQLKRGGFEAAIALQDAFGVPPAQLNGGEAGTAGGGRTPPPMASPGQRGMMRQQRDLAASFASRSVEPLLVTTEHSARGLDLKGLDAVIMVGLPARVESYVHVAGRTAREGRKGRAVSLLTTEEEVERIGAFGKKLGVVVEMVDVRFL